MIGCFVRRPERPELLYAGRVCDIDRDIVAGVKVENEVDGAAADCQNMRI